MKKTEAIVHKVSYVIYFIARISLICMALLTTVDVVARYLFNSPILGAQDVTELLMILLIFGAMGWATYKRAHIRADMFNSILSPRKYAIYSAAGFVLCLVFSVLMAWQTFLSAIKSMKAFNELTFTIGIPTAPFQLFTAICLFVLCLELLFDVLNYMKEAKTNTPNSVVI